MASAPFLVPIDLNNLEIQNVKLQNLSPAPTAGIGKGSIFFDSTSGQDKPKWYDGSAWQTIWPFSDSGNATVGTITGTFSGNLTGNVTGNVSGSSGSCTGNAAGLSATLAVASGGTGTTTGSITGTGKLVFTAGPSDKDIELTPTGSGSVIVTNGSISAPDVSTGTLTATGLVSITGATSGLSVPDVTSIFLGIQTDTISNKASGGGITLNPETSVSLSSKKIVSLADPTDDQDAATKKYVDNKVQGLDVKESCLTATTADISLSSPGSSIGGVTVSATDSRILVKNQSDNTQNGIYLWKGATSAMVRSSDADTVAKLVGAFTFVEQGTNADSGWTCTVDSGTIGSAAIEWTKFSQAGSYTPGRGITQSGTAFNFAQDGAYTAGQIPFPTGASSIGFSSNLFWDNGNSRLGIGTATPAIVLDVNGSSATTSGLLVRNQTTAVAFIGNEATYTGSGTSNNAAVAAYGSNSLLFGTNASTRLTIASDGVFTWSNVGAVATAMTLNATGLGIGTATPVDQLTLYRASGSGITSGISLTTAAGAGGDGSYIKWTGGGTNEKIARIDGVLNGTDVGYLSFLCGNGSDDFAEQYRIASSGVFTWYDGAGGTRMTLNSTGLGIGQTPSAKLHVYGDTYTNSQLRLQRNGAVTGTFSIGIAGTNNTLYIQDEVNSTPRLIIDGSGNLGIGVASPSYKLQVGDGTTDARALFKSNNAFSIGVQNASNQIGGWIGSSGNNVLTFAGNDGTIKATLDSSGNLGLGVTPSAWSSSYKAIQLGSGGTSFWGGVNFSEYDQNAYWDGTNMKYVNAFAASKYYQANGAHSWHTAPSGTAGNNITFTQAMTLDASGRLLLGTVGSVFSGITVQAQATTGGGIGIINDATLNYGRLDFLNASNGGYTRITGDGRSTGYIAFITNDTTRLTISSTGAATFTGDVTINGTGYVKNGTANTSQIARTYNATLSATSNTEFTVNHNLGTRSVMVQVRQVASPYATVVTDVERTDSDNVKIKFASNVTGSDYNVVVLG